MFHQRDNCGDRPGIIKPSRDKEKQSEPHVLECGCKDVALLQSAGGYAVGSCWREKIGGAQGLPGKGPNAKPRDLTSTDLWTPQAK